MRNVMFINFEFIQLSFLRPNFVLFVAIKAKAAPLHAMEAVGGEDI
jgi:hypothetical protein